MPTVELQGSMVGFTVFHHNIGLINGQTQFGLRIDDAKRLIMLLNIVSLKMS